MGLRSCSNHFLIQTFLALTEAFIFHAAINGCVPFPLGCSFFNPSCLPQCHPAAFFFIDFQVCSTC